MNTRRLLPVPGVPIGYRKNGRPIYPVLGGSGGEEFDVETDGETEDEESEDEPDGTDGDKKGKDDKWTPPSKAEWLKVQAALSKSNASAKQRREALAERDRELQKLRDDQATREAEAERQALLDGQPGGRKAKKAAAPPPAPVLPEGVLTKAQVRQLTAQAAREAEERAADKFRGMAVNQAARAALASSGVQSGNVGRLVRLLDLGEVQIDDEGEVVEGLEEQIETLKAELPQLFRPAEADKPKPRRAPAPRIQPSGRTDADNRPLTSAEQMARQVLGQRV